MTDNTAAVPLPPIRKLRHWDALKLTDPEHTKPFRRAGGFSGTAIKPIWNEYRMTEHFGPAGIGWGMDKPEFQLVPAGDELMVYCTVALWYTDPQTERAYVWGVGGDKVIAQQSRGMFADDEAFKKAFTDALGNAMKHIGVSADVHMGEFDGSKYVADSRERLEPAPSRLGPPPSRKTRFQKAKQEETTAMVPNERLIELASQAANKGYLALQQFCQALDSQERAAIKDIVVNELQPMARRVDAAKVEAMPRGGAFIESGLT